MLALVLGVVLAAAVLAWRLSEGPIVLDGLKPYVEAMLSPPDAGFTTRVGGTSISWSGWGKPLDLVAEDLTLVEPDGAVRVRVDRVAVGLSPKALLDGRLAPQRVDVLDPRITVVRTTAGGWRLMPESEGPAPEFDLAGLLRTFAGTEPGGPLSDLTEVDVSGARIRLLDNTRGVALVAYGVSASLLRTADGLAFEGHGTTAWDGGSRTPLELDGSYRRDQGRVEFEARVTRLPLNELGGLHPSLWRLGRVVVPASGVVRIASGVSGVGLSGSADFTLGAGSVAATGLNDMPIDLAGGTLRATLAPDLDRAELTAVLDLRGPKLTLSAAAARSGRGYAVTADATAAAVPLNDFARLWPASVAAAAREWVTTNLRDGVMPQATVRAEAWIDPTAAGSLRLDRLGGRIDFTDATAHYFRPLPPVTGIAGSATFDADGFDVAITAGRLDRLVLDPSLIRIRGLIAENETIDIDAAVRGPLLDAMRLIDHKPLGYPSKLGIDPAGVEGLAGARLRFDFPLLKDLQLEQVNLAVAANLTDVTLPKVVAGHTLDDADLKLDLDGAGMKLTGTGRVLGAASEVELDQRFHRRGPFTSRSRLKTTATRQSLLAFGLDFSDVVDIAGRAAIDAQSEIRPDGVETVRVAADLRDTVLRVTELGWRKPAGVSGALRTRLTVRNGTPVSVDEFDMQAGDMIARAVATLGPRSVIKVIDLARLRIGRTDAAGRVERLASGEWRVSLKGPTIDLSPVVDGDEATPAGAAAPAEPATLALDLRAAADTLIVTRTASMTGATLAVRLAGPRLESMDLRGRIGDGFTSITVQPVDGQRQLTLRAEDAGGFLRAFDIVDTVNGGRLGVDGVLTGPGLEDGLQMTARIEEFHVVKAPVLAQLLSVASFTGLADTLRGDGIQFARARADLTLTPDRIEARNGIAYGPGLGLKVEGANDRNSELIDFVGMIAPAHSLSRLIDKIPVLGELLTGGPGEGLLATEFRLRGTFADPSVSVNPLTTLAPGFLRDLLTTAERPADAPVVAPPPTPSPQFEREDRGR